MCSSWVVPIRAQQIQDGGRPPFLPRDAMSESVTSRTSTKTAKRRITQTTPHNSQGILVFRCQRSPRNSTGVPPTGAPNAGGVGQNRRLSTNKLPAISRKRYKIDAWFLLKSNRKSYALYRTVTLPMTFSDH